uniref:Gem-associated protein 2 n=1 Tax=Rodentolepis nana TaxID=102285 RepID=A0A0R3T0R0_RODNA
LQMMDYLAQSASADESSDEELLKPALPVTELNDDCLDYSNRYLDPNNYLLYVRNEAAKYPVTLTAPMDSETSLGVEEIVDEDYEERNGDNQESICENTGIKSFLGDFSKSWLQSQAKNFASSQKEFRFAVDVLLSSKMVQSTSDEFTKALCSNNFFDWLLDNPVKLSHFIDLRQDKLVDFLHELLAVCSPNDWKSGLQTWLYAALLALEKPLLPNTCSLLRNIAEQFCEHLRVFAKAVVLERLFVSREVSLGTFDDRESETMLPDMQEFKTGTYQRRN